MISVTLPSRDTRNSAESIHSVSIESVFNTLFLTTLNTRLVGGADEPLYMPSNSGEPNTIFYRSDYVSSALHECSHWCIAGAKRRLLEDYGYWYMPDGRSELQQHRFEQVEVKPQALEWLLSEACGTPFRLSADNLELGCGPSVEFARRVQAQAVSYCSQGLPERADALVDGLSSHFSTNPLCLSHYTLEALNVYE